MTRRLVYRLGAGINAVIGMRADESAEEMGLDLAEHDERAYNH